MKSHSSYTYTGQTCLLLIYTHSYQVCVTGCVLCTRVCNIFQGMGPKNSERAMKLLGPVHPMTWLKMKTAKSQAHVCSKKNDH